ncbi:rCG30508 [Rattus norvegicus]|uniref:RCG30508 n=1 Tax=Rattus norvegicus TaxID=10116 RepID=A6JFQ2_RAT|nr:rCG30508 [Rattus norvegicus]
MTRAAAEEACSWTGAAWAILAVINDSGSSGGGLFLDGCCMGHLRDCLEDALR